MYRFPKPFVIITQCVLGGGGGGGNGGMAFSGVGIYDK